MKPSAVGRKWARLRDAALSAIAADAAPVAELIEPEKVDPERVARVERIQAFAAGEPIAPPPTIEAEPVARERPAFPIRKIGRRVIDWRPTKGTVDLGDPPPGRSALDRRSRGR